MKCSEMCSLSKIGSTCQGQVCSWYRVSFHRMTITCVRECPSWRKGQHDFFPPSTPAAQLALHGPPTNVVQTFESHGSRPNTRERFTIFPSPHPFILHPASPRCQGSPSSWQEEAKHLQDPRSKRCDWRSWGLKFLPVNTYR